MTLVLPPIQSGDLWGTILNQAMQAAYDASQAAVATANAAQAASAVAPFNTAASLGNVSGVLDLSTRTSPQTLRATLTGNVTGVTLPTGDPSLSYTLTLVLTQDATGSRTLTFSAGTVRFAYDVAPVLSTAPGAVDMVHLFWTGAAWWVLPAATGSTGLKP